MSRPLPDDDPAMHLLLDEYVSAVADVHRDSCYICRDPEFAQMGMPLCRPCPECGGHVPADDSVCDDCGGATLTARAPVADWQGVDLCTGAGLFAEGAKQAGVVLRLCIDIDVYGKNARPLGAVATSQAAGHPAVKGDIADLSLYADLIQKRAAQADPPPLIVFGGPPCQPFSSAGKRQGADDSRDAFPAALAAIDALQPRRVVLENVKGLRNHRKGCPGRSAVDPEPLGYEEAAGLGCPGCYLARHLLPEMRKRFAHAGYWLLDAADYGVPQRRWRVFLWGSDVPLAAPAPTHSGAALVHAKWVSGAYWAEHGLAPGEAVEAAVMFRGRGGPGAGTTAEPTSVDCPSVAVSGATGGSTRPQLCRGVEGAAPAKWEQRLLKKIQTGDTAGLGLKRWRTIRDTLPALQGPARVIGGGRNPRSTALAGTRNYRDLSDEPSVAMTAEQVGNRGPWVEAPDQTRRRLTPQECALLQDAPPDYPWQGNKTQLFRQIGNAVPCGLARAVIQAVTNPPPELSMPDSTPTPWPSTTTPRSRQKVPPSARASSRL